MNFFDHKDVGNHLPQLCPEVVKHPVCVCVCVCVCVFVCVCVCACVRACAHIRMHLAITVDTTVSTIDKTLLQPQTRQEIDRSAVGLVNIQTEGYQASQAIYTPSLATVSRMDSHRHAFVTTPSTVLQWPEVILSNSGQK
jgi:hypothetical protein